MNEPLSQPAEPTGSRVLAVRPLVLAWFMAIGVDLLLNAGLFSGLFDQTREPGLLPDDVLFRRIPVAYLSLGVVVVCLGWLFDRTDLRGPKAGAALGALSGLVVASMGIVTLWTAIDITGLFVAAGAFVQVCMLAASGAVLGAFRANGDRRRLSRRVLLFALLAALAGIVTQNVLSPDVGHSLRRRSDGNHEAGPIVRSFISSTYPEPDRRFFARRSRVRRSPRPAPHPLWAARHLAPAFRPGRRAPT